MKALPRGLSSLRLTLLVMLLLILVILYDLAISKLHVGWLAACLGLLSLNLAAAIAVRPQFRRQPGLLVFHICLMVVAGLAAAQVLTSFEGRVELAEKQTFSLEDTKILKVGPWHVNHLDNVRFTQGPVSVEYRPNLRRGRTSSEVFSVKDGREYSTVFGDTRPFRTESYRFITTANKGFALALSWLDENGRTSSGIINMPSYPVQEWDQRNQWSSPAGEALVFELENVPVPVNEPWTLSSREFEGRVFLHRNNAARIEMVPGNKVNMRGGELRLDEVVLWLGYRIESNLILPWLFASAALGTIALGWHFWRNPPVFRASVSNHANSTAA